MEGWGLAILGYFVVMAFVILMELITIAAELKVIATNSYKWRA